MSFKEIVIISGKGGTGKTSVTASLLPFLSSPVIADCDVDAPNLSILLQPEEGTTKTVSLSRKAVINQEQCTGCGTCVSACPFDAINQDESGVSVQPMLCEGCKVCTLVCSADAISVVKAETGTMKVSGTEYGPLYHARLNPGEEVSGKLISNLKKEAREAVEKEKADFLLVDGPPGVACNTISSMSGSDLAVIVTEPSVSAIHDLKRVWEITNHFSIPASVIINKSGLSEQEKQIHVFCELNDIPIIGEVPYSSDIHNMITQCQIPSTGEDNLNRLFKTMVQKMLDILYTESCGENHAKTKKTETMPGASGRA